MKLVLLLNVIIKTPKKSLGQICPPPQIQLSWIYSPIQLGLKWKICAPMSNTLASILFLLNYFVTRYHCLFAFCLTIHGFLNIHDKIRPIMVSHKDPLCSRNIIAFEWQVQIMAIKGLFKVKLPPTACSSSDY